MSETTAEPQQQLPPPYHHHQPRQSNSRHTINGSRRDGELQVHVIEKYAFCLCLHVKPTTLFIASFKLIDALFFISILLNAEHSFDEQASNDLTYNNSEGVHRLTVVALGILTRVIMASVSTVAIYAVMSGRAALLMPLYSVLLIDFFFALPSFYGRDADSALPNPDGVFGMKNYPNNDSLSRYTVFISMLTMITKIYCLCVIWKCYRYLRLIQLVAEMCTQRQSPVVRVLELEDGTRNSNSNNSAAPPPYDSVASNSKPPNYEEAMKSNVYTININQRNGQLLNYSNPSKVIDGTHAKPTDIAPLSPTDESLGQTNS